MRRLRNLFLMIFVSFYLLTTLSGVQFRTERVAQRVVASTTADVRMQVGDPIPQLFDTYPRFREAKKAAMYGPIRHSSVTLLPPTLPDRDFYLDSELSHQLLITDTNSVRGPPSLL